MLMKKVMLVTLLLGLFLVATGWAQSGQVVFGTTDNPNPGATTAGTFAYTSLNPKDKLFGFWIWCEAESTNPYTGRCNGAMYFYGIALTKGVFGTVTESRTQKHVYVMTVRSSDNKVVCTLTNVLPITKGITNTVNAACSAPSGVGVSLHTVVQSTGP
jgi:hypothetical protein